MCPNQELNLQLSRVQDDTRSNWATCPGLFLTFKVAKIFERIMESMIILLKNFIWYSTPFSMQYLLYFYISVETSNLTSNFNPRSCNSWAHLHLGGHPTVFRSLFLHGLQVLQFQIQHWRLLISTSVPEPRVTCLAGGEMDKWCDKAVCLNSTLLTFGVR